MTEQAGASSGFHAELCCPRCGTPVPFARWGVSEPAPCPRCGERYALVPFPALFRQPESGRAGDVLVDDRDASCFYHVRRQAVVACDECGRFLCRLCDLDLGERHVCPQCFDAGRQAPDEETSVDRAVLYDSIALTVALAPMLVFYFTLITGPIALFMVIRYWNRVVTPTPRSRWRFVVAGLLATLQIVGWVALLSLIIVAL